MEYYLNQKELRALPTMNQPQQPYAVYIGAQLDVNKKRHAIYNIIGGSDHGDTVSYKTLQKKSIPIIRTIIYRFIKTSFMTWDTIKIIKFN